MNRNQKIIDEEYRAWANRGCTINHDCHGPIDQDHVKARGLGSGKQNDLLILELCRKHHSERGTIGDEKFQAKYGINLHEEIAWSLIEWIQELKLREREAWVKVADMRRLQGRYFKSRSQPSLIEAKQAERVVDRILVDKGLADSDNKAKGFSF